MAVFNRADPEFFLGGGAPLKNDFTDWRGKQILKANTKKKALSRAGGGGVHTPCTLPLDPPLVNQH